MTFRGKIVNCSAYANVLKIYQHVELYVEKYARVTGSAGPWSQRAIALARLGVGMCLGVMFKV